jgi:hypothetical protein
MSKCIITGLGGQGLGWVKQLRQHEDCEIVAYIEPTEANQSRAVEQHEVPREQIYTSLDDALKAVQA